jgi:Fic family protein
MKLPLPAPQIPELMDSEGDRLMAILTAQVGAEVNGNYEHWDKLRHRPAPEGLTTREWWLAIKMKRQAIRKRLPLFDKDGNAFCISITDSMQRLLHYVDREAAGAIKGIEGSGGQERFLIRSLIEEAMTSSQLEGAATTRAIAKEMLSTGRQPRDKSERMIYNNYVAMNRIREMKGQPITPEAIIELHSMLTDGTMEDDGDCGKLRSAEDNIVIYDRGNPPTLLHTPPAAEEVPSRLRKLCAFANDTDGEAFIHPVVRAIAIHFQIGYDHPFVDGNGRTARALFYWSMLNNEYWMTEYLSISSVLKKAPGKYLKAYLYTESDGQDLGYFIAHQLDAIEKSIHGLHDYIKRKHVEDQAARKVLRNARVGELVLNHRQRALLANAIKHQDRSYTVAGHQASHTVTYPTALTDLNTLAKAGLLVKHRIGKAYEYMPVGDLRQRLAI